MIYIIGIAVIAAVILFRDEIRELLAFLVVGYFVSWLWTNPAWWGRPAGAIAGALAGLAYIGLIVQKWQKAAAQWAPQQPPAQAVTPAPAAPQRYAGGIDDWFYRLDGREYGPVPKRELLYLLERGHIPPTTPVRYMDGPWTPANQMITFRR